MRVVALLAVLVMAVAGCNGSTQTPSATSEAVDPTAPEPLVSETEGGIYGLIVDDQQIPVPRAEIALLRDGSVMANATGALDGSFSFGNLAPGKYVVSASALPYSQRAAVTDVAAGQVARLLITLERLALPEPHLGTEILNGHTTCTVSLRTPANYLRPSCKTAIASDVWNIQYPLAAGFVELLVETDWTPTYSHGNELLQIVRLLPYSGEANIRELEGPGPMRIYVPHEDWVAWDAAKGTNYTQAGGPLSLSTFAAHNVVSQPSPVEVGILLDQHFTVYSTAAFNTTIPATFTAIPDR